MSTVTPHDLLRTLYTMAMMVEADMVRVGRE